MFDADRPITKSAQDQLGRSAFSRYLARSILDHQNPESLVIGLYGGWGAGKTSIINLTLEELRIAASNMADEEMPVILNFSPWSYSGQKQLVYNFFRRLSSEIQRSPYIQNSSKIIELLELYVSFFTREPAQPIVHTKRNMLEKMTRSRSAKDVKLGWESGRDLTQVKMELNALLARQKHKMIIFIDNIARVEDNEIKQIFQIVKSMGDYVNTVYVLALDKHHVIRALDNIYGEGGEQYLEKIVQLPIEIPEISRQNLENILLDRLNQVVKTIPASNWDKNDWADLYYSTLKYFFKTSRDVTRYVNTLSFSFSRVRELVNPVDFFAITVLAVFSPKVYEGIRDNKDLFTDFINAVFEPDHDKWTEDKLRCDEILSRSENISQDYLLPLLLRLFPQLRTIYKVNEVFYHSDDIARLNRRICSADVFDIYFRMSLPSGQMSEGELNAVLQLADDEAAFSQAILRLNKDERVEQFLDVFDNFAIEKINKNNIQKVIDTFVNCADLFPDGKNDALHLSTPMRMHKIFHQLLRRFNSRDERFVIMREAIKKSVMSLYIFIYELTEQTNDQLSYGETIVPDGLHDFTLEQLDALKKLAVSKIMYWAESGRLQEHPRLLDILNAWQEWGNAEDCKRFTSMMVQNDEGLLAFLLHVLRDPIDQAMTKLKINPEWQRSLQVIENFTFIAFLAPHVKMLFEDPGFEKLTEREQLAILIFLDLIHAETLKTMPDVS